MGWVGPGQIRHFHSTPRGSINRLNFPLPRNNMRRTFVESLITQFALPNFVKIWFADILRVPKAEEWVKSTSAQIQDGKQRPNWKLEDFRHFLGFSIARLQV